MSPRQTIWEPAEPLPEPVPPPGGWKQPTCSFTSHKWVLDVEEGRAYVRCADPCNGDEIDPAANTPVCLAEWMPEDFGTVQPIPVALTYVDDSTPSTPAGPYEPGWYFELRPEGDA